MPRKRSPLDHLLQTDHDPADPALSYVDSTSEDRSNQRHVVAIEAVLRSPPGEYAVCIRALSQSGLTLEGAPNLGPGQRCQIILPGMRPRAIDIIWREDVAAGACFAELLSRAILDGLLSRYEEPHI